MTKTDHRKYINILGCSTKEEVLALVKSWTSDRTDMNHIVRSIVLDIHASIESMMKEILYEHLSDLILWMEGYDELHESCLKELDRIVKRMSFSQVHKLLRPCFKSFVATELDEYIPVINNLRNEFAHKKTGSIKYKGRDPSEDPDCFAQIYLDSWYVHSRLNEFIERRISDQRAMNERGWECYAGRCTNKKNAEE
ncbi:hypothetical protein CEE37_01910 [candidate division LCP-89 bacterium B3_LCP]|uniref:RiboL-PSP-HEPN domain-containing protein n=1 Tax=candidate division LCP-89 bacterium B3_LCP TaxID=2012998 RepID=A0A532V5Q3_UNCL8|nr:MAG: hypothetical protein CEE37_01910 [candidate division LCP-89 bacterium B3_LCP]